MKYNRFVERAVKIFGDKYKYLLFEGDKNKNDYIDIICPIHGNFNQRIINHLRGFGCVNCGGSKKLTLEEFIKRSHDIHGDKYNYDKVVLKNVTTNVIIVCPIHGDFEQKPIKHMSGQGCSLCIGNKKLTLEQFINRATKNWDGFYKYHLIKEYVNCDSKVPIECPVHGVFWQSPYSHLKYKCRKCADDHTAYLNNFNDVICKFKEIHGDKYDYSLVKYSGLNYKINIICSLHGVFDQTPYSHICGRGCPKCGFYSMVEKSRNDINYFLDRARKIHGNKYDYSKFECKGYTFKSIIICSIHGEFLQNQRDHLDKCGCPKCGAQVNITRFHNDVSGFVKSLGVDIIDNDRDIVKPNEIDIFICSKMFGIELHGLYWHSYNRMESKDERMKHYNKYEICSSSGVRLLQIFENEWIDRQDIVRSIISSKLGFSSRIFARQCDVREIDSVLFNDFCVSNHIQGKLYSKVRVGLFFGDRLVCVMGFNPHDKYGWEVTRFCNVIGFNVVGGASRLFKFFVGKINPSCVLSFADRRFSDGNLYYKLGFVLEHVSNPGYFYVDHLKLLNRRKFQKHKLCKLLKVFDPGLSESVNMFNNGYRRIWDAGHFKFLWYKT